MTDSHFIKAELAPTPAAYLSAARRVESGEVPELRDVRIAIISTVSTQMLRPFLIVEGARRGLRIVPWFAPYGQLELVALDTNGPLYAEKPEAIVILARMEDLAPDQFERFSTDAKAVSALVDGVENRVRGLLASLRERTSASLFMANFAPPEYLIGGVGDAMLETSQTVSIQKANTMLAVACDAVPGAFVFDYARVAAEHGLLGWYDARLFAVARQPWSVAAQIATAGGLARTLRAALVAPAKCLVLDADNTLWGGVVGEEGLGGIALGDDYPGNAFKGFQKYLRALKERGVLLALVSKNEESDVFEVLDRHPDSILRRADFASCRINWREKSANLPEVAAELGVGLDALVLFDDNPFEREEVRQALPAVTVLDVPADPLQYIATVAGSVAFDQLRFSPEDQHRAALYQQAQVRTEARRGASSPEEFLAGLEMVATVGIIAADTLPRVVQLLGKTNQFNLTTRRHSAAQITKMIDAGAIALWLRLADRFGDHGLVGVAIARPLEGQWMIDSFLLSCRVIGRGAETALLARLIEAIKAKGGRELFAEYLPTEKNRLVADMYPNHGFVPCGENRWIKKLSEPALAPACIEVHFS